MIEDTLQLVREIERGATVQIVRTGGHVETVSPQLAEAVRRCAQSIDSQRTLLRYGDGSMPAIRRPRP